MTSSSPERAMVGPKVYDIDEANALIPTLEAAFEELDKLREQLKVAKIKLNALEMIWGQGIQSEENPDHKEAVSLINELKTLEEKFSEVVSRLNAVGATVKDLDEGLVDLYHVRDGLLVFLCWKRGEDEIEAWHHVDAGYADRQIL
jgi:hypothetical protein